MCSIITIVTMNFFEKLILFRVYSSRFNNSDLKYKRTLSITHLALKLCIFLYSLSSSRA